MTRPFCIAPPEIGFDFDGVIADTGAAFLELACSKYGYCSFSLTDITHFEVENCIPIPRPVVEAIFQEILEDSLATGLRPMRGAVEVLSELAEHGPVTVITARHLRQPVVDWFDQFFPKSTRQGLTIEAMGNHDDKLRYIRQHQLRYFVDDRAETCAMLAAEQITPLVFDQPWNRDRHSCMTVQNWGEIRAFLDLPFT